MRKANKSRGEVAVTVGGQELILCATMENLDSLQQELGDKDLGVFMEELHARSVPAVKTGFHALVLDGDAANAWKSARGAVELVTIGGAVVDALVPDPEGNVTAGAESP